MDFKRSFESIVCRGRGRVNADALDTLPCVILRSFIACCVLCASWPAHALLTRPDREDAEYLELATRYPSAITLGASGAEGVLFHPLWILTTATNARALQGEGKSVSFASRSYRVQAVYAHPLAREGQPENVALIRLRDAVHAVAATPLYRGADEAGKGVVFVAHGPAGRRGEALRTRDGKARGAINTIERVSPLTLSVQIREGDEASDLQGVLIPGEEGAPAFIETPEGIFAAGLYHGDVTVWNLFSRLSAFLPWVEATMVGHERDALQEQLER
jgi:hypothetical protein